MEVETDQSLNMRLPLAIFRAPNKCQALKNEIECFYKSNLHSLLCTILVAFYAEIRTWHLITEINYS